LKTSLKPHLLRRFKRDVLKQMPKRKEVIVRVEMTHRQKQICKRLISDNLQELKEVEMKKNKSLGQVNNLLVYLRQIADHPLLLSGSYCTDNFRSQKLFKQLQLEHSKSLEEMIECSAKLVHLNYMLDRLLKDHKVLIFSQFKGMLSLLGDYLSGKGVKFLKLDGDTPNNLRQGLIDQFNKDDFRVFLLSTRAGGLGLNLTQADTVFIIDSDFNPHND